MTREAIIALTALYFVVGLAVGIWANYRATVWESCSYQGMRAVRDDLAQQWLCETDDGLTKVYALPWRRP